MKIKSIFKTDYVWLLLLSCIVLLPNFYLASVGNELSESFFAKIAYLLISFVIFFTPALFLKARCFFLLHSIFVLFAPIEIIHIYLNKRGITTGFLIACFGTDKNEALEILTSMLPVILISLLIWTSYFFILLKKVKNRYIIPNVKIRIGILAIFISLLTGLFVSIYRVVREVPQIEQNRAIPLTWEYFFMKFQKIYPCSFILKSIYIVEMNTEIAKNREELSDFSFNAEKKQPIAEREIYVFVIGETARYSNFSINGYERKTSPLLEATEDLVSFSDFYAEANQTFISLPLIFTRATPTDYHRYTKEKSFIAAFKEAGFKTYWIGNQCADDKFVRRLIIDIDEEFFGTKDWNDADNYDQNLWKYLDEILNKNDEKALIIIHTLGSHFRYDSRYPSKFNVFKSNFEKNINYNIMKPKDKQLWLNAYDNSILYTDYFLANTIKKIENQNALSFFVYTSDHGEDLFDTDENRVLHASSNPSKFEIHVPLFIWSSKKYQEIYSEKWKNILANKDKKTSAKILFYSMLDAADITFPEQDLEQCFTSDFMKEDSVRYVLTPDMSVKSFK